MTENKNFCVFTIQNDLFTTRETGVYYLTAHEIFDKFLECGANSARIDCGTTSKKKPEFFCGKKIIVNDKGLFYQ